MSQRGSRDGPQDGDPAAPIVRDFADLSSSSAPDVTQLDSASLPEPDTARPPVRVHYNLDAPHLTLDTSMAGAPSGDAGVPASGILRAETGIGMSPMIRRRNTRVATFKTVDDYEDFDVRDGWHPGAEPGVDPSKPDGGHASMPTLQVDCEITVVDFSQDDMVMYHLDNATLPPFLLQPQPAWAKCRWISVSGLSWDVISALGQYKKLHKLAIEDIMNARNRTKADWYSNHAFFIFTLQKLVHLSDPEHPSDSDDSSDDDSDDGHSLHSSIKRQGIFRKLRHWWRKPKRKAAAVSGGSVGSLEDGEIFRANTGGLYNKTSSGIAQPLNLHQKKLPRTLQGYHATPNDQSRVSFMEKFSVLSEKKLVVTAEQVSIFITNDNTVISFIEESAEDVETPIITRLSAADTILRQSCDASMVGQAIMDAIVDLAIPVTACYADVIGDLELDVLTRPNLSHTKKVYITITEINRMLSFINPIIGLLNSMRDHKTDMHQDEAARELQNPAKGVIITPMTSTYLGDVLDHCVLITESLQQLKSQADGMIDLIFNTITAYQNESLKQLTLMTIIFLPLTFITGYFGQNFEPFDVLKEDVGYFWKCAVPTVFATICVLMREIIWDSFKSLLQHRHVLQIRRNKRKRRRLAKSQKNR